MRTVILIPGLSFLLGSHEMVGHPAGVVELNSQLRNCDRILEILENPRPEGLRNYNLLENFLKPWGVGTLLV